MWAWLEWMLLWLLLSAILLLAAGAAGGAISELLALLAHPRVRRATKGLSRRVAKIKRA